MVSTAKVGRVRGGAVLGLLAVGSLVACSSGTSGTAATQPYQPLDPGTVQVAEVQINKGAIGVAPDLSAEVVVGDDGKTCLVPRSGGSGSDTPPTDSQGTSTQGTSTQDPGTQDTGSQDPGTQDSDTQDGAVCADLPAESHPVSAVFSPDGSRYAVFPDANMFDTSGTWIVEAATGEAVQVAMDGAIAAATASDTSAPAPSSSGPDSTESSSSDTESSSSDTEFVEILQGGVWKSNDELIGFGSQLAVRIDPTSGNAELVFSTRVQELIWMYAVGGNTAVVLQESDLTAIDLDSGTVGTPITIAEKGVRPILLGVSPDGRTALVTTSDARTFKTGPTRLVSLQDGSETELDLPAETFTFAGSFSPDGSQIVLFSAFNGEGLPAGDTTSTPQTTDDAGDGDDDSSSGRAPLTVVAAAADGTGLQAIGSSDATPYGPMAWSRNNVLTVDPRMAPSRAAWQLSAG